MDTGDTRLVSERYEKTTRQTSGEMGRLIQNNNTDWRAEVTLVNHGQRPEQMANVGIRTHGLTHGSSKK